MEKELDENITKRISTPFTDGDLERHMGVKPNEIIKYADLSQYQDIEELLPHDKSFKIILIEDKYNSGHWVAIMRYGKTIEYFNSYGAKYDTDWKFINRMTRMILGENTNDMTRLMDGAKKNNWNVIYNKHRYQKLDSKIQTCGRWAVLRVEMMKMGYNNQEFFEQVHRLMEETGGSSDYTVCRYVF